MADQIDIKRGYGALYFIEMSLRAVEAIRANPGTPDSIGTIEQFDLADTVVNNGPSLKY